MGAIALAAGLAVDDGGAFLGEGVAKGVGVDASVLARYAPRGDRAHPDRDGATPFGDIEPCVRAPARQGITNNHAFNDKNDTEKRVPIPARGWELAGSRLEKG